VSRAVKDERVCPTCGRWLVRIYDDATFDLNAKASGDVRLFIRMAGGPVPVATVRAASPLDAAAVDLPGGVHDIEITRARCLLWRCRLRRLLDRAPAVPA
jgi:hypothetical protein